MKLPFNKIILSGKYFIDIFSMNHTCKLHIILDDKNAFLQSVLCANIDTKTEIV
jgi:hypothetical protein